MRVGGRFSSTRWASRRQSPLERTDTPYASSICWSQGRGSSFGTTVARGLRNTKNVLAATRRPCAANSCGGGLRALNERTKLRTGAPVGPGPEEILDISHVIVQRHWLVEVGRAVSDAAERMQGVRMGRMQNAQTVAEVDYVGQIPHYASAMPALGIDQSTVHGTFEEGLDTGGDHDHAGSVVLRTQLVNVGIDCL